MEMKEKKIVQNKQNLKNRHTYIYYIAQRIGNTVQLTKALTETEFEN